MPTRAGPKAAAWPMLHRHSRNQNQKWQKSLAAMCREGERRRCCSARSSWLPCLPRAVWSPATTRCSACALSPTLPICPTPTEASGSPGLGTTICRNAQDLGGCSEAALEAPRPAALRDAPPAQPTCARPEKAQTSRRPCCRRARAPAGKASPAPCCALWSRSSPQPSHPNERLPQPPKIPAPGSPRRTPALGAYLICTHALPGRPPPSPQPPHPWLRFCRDPLPPTPHPHLVAQPFRQPAAAARTIPAVHQEFSIMKTEVGSPP